jgi:folylpolyglutamate synthase
MTLFVLAPCIRRAILLHPAAIPLHPAAIPSPRRFSTTSPARTSSSDRTYDSALSLLKTLQSNRAIRSVLGDATKNEDPNRNAIPEMLAWARRAGYEASELGKWGQRYIHVAGTKGKGSVCVMVENILLQYKEREEVGKIGLYTSPHLVSVRERIRIDGQPISEGLFTRYFYELWDRFERAAVEGWRDILPDGDTRPGYFRYLTLLAIHAFVQEGVKTAVMECGIGGEYDSTNILPADAVAASAISRLGIDHTPMLGETIGEIAWHKGGIMKEGAPAFTMNQRPEALAVLEKRAIEKRVDLGLVPRLPVLAQGEIQLGLLGDFQRDNASLATAVAASYLRGAGITEGVPSPHDLEDPNLRLPPQFGRGLETVTWPGRCEIRKDGNVEWFIDGAHTIDSIKAVSSWFCSKLMEACYEPRPPTATMLIFNQEERDGKALLAKLLFHRGFFDGNFGIPSYSPRFLPATMKKLKPAMDPDLVFGWTRLFTYAAFCKNEPFAVNEKNGPVDLGCQEGLAMAYSKLDGNQLTMCYSSVEEAVDLAYRVSEGDERVLVLVTGSLHLVGGLLQVLEKRKKEPPVRRIPREEIEEPEQEVLGSVALRKRDWLRKMMRMRF